jgi:epoxyqueuosine reductase
MKELTARLGERGFQGRFVSIRHLSELQEEITARYRSGQLHQDLYQIYLGRFAFAAPDTLAEATGVLIVAVPQPRTQVTVTWHGKPVALTIPPTYLERETGRRVREVVEEVLSPAGYHLAEAFLPKKLLATRSGLAAYGRNNITYVPGMGSFHGLVVLFTDLPVQTESWGEPQMLARCEKCSACRRACPTGAISSERFLLHAERCLTLYNERPSEYPFPAWIEPSWHNCLTGCLHCQRVCPENNDVWSWTVEGTAFSEEETVLLLAGSPLAELPASTVQKLERIEMDGYVEALPRNLSVLLERV